MILPPSNAILSNLSIPISSNIRNMQFGQFVIFPIAMFFSYIRSTSFHPIASNQIAIVQSVTQRYLVNMNINSSIDIASHIRKN